MGIFDVDEKKLQTLYHRAWNESGHGAVNTRAYPYLDKALTQFLPARISAPMMKH